MKEKMSKDFFWGGSVSAHQTEGANTKEYGKGKSVYDKFGEKVGFPEWSINAGTDAYHRYEEDFDLLKEMGMNSYRFSIAWSRIFPNGDGQVNEEGVRFYHHFIDALIERGIEPMICAYHFDLPYALHEKFGGWTSRKTVEAFIQYTQFLIDEYGEKVHWWIPMNEQNGCKLASAVLGGHSKSDSNFNQNIEQINYHLNLAAAGMIKYSHVKYPNNQIGVMINYCPIYPETAHPSDILTAQLQDEDANFNTLDVMINGTYPTRNQIAWNKKEITPEIVSGDRECMLNINPDFIGISYYSSQMTNRTFENYRFSDALLDSIIGKPSPFPKNSFLHRTEWDWTIDPVGLRGGLNKLFSRYNLPIFIMENGVGVIEYLNENGTIEDSYRVDFFKTHISEMRKAIFEDGVNCIGYQTWAPIDILSSRGEMKKRYGFIYVDRDDHSVGTMNRIKKESFYWYKDLIDSKGVLADE
ncbi:glycoside hydrolase family 1 protein [Enterococcus sp. DIV0756]|uniref:glycoside hydrolase family 1 protein n=1 Tax=Enterococcus sp. DIV0756 TaxID=2774636 RepID=UPI003F22B8B0